MVCLFLTKGNVFSLVSSENFLLHDNFTNSILKPIHSSAAFNRSGPGFLCFCGIISFNILKDSGAAGQEEEIFVGESLQQQQPLLCKLSPTEIPSCRLTAPGSPRMQFQLHDQQSSSLIFFRLSFRNCG